MIRSTRFIRHISVTCLALAAGGGFGCEDEFMPPGARPAVQQDAGQRPVREMPDLSGLEEVDVEFRLLAGGEPFNCSSDAVSMGSSSTPLRLEDARFFVSRVRFIDANGEEHAAVFKPDETYQQSTVALLDFVDGTGGCQFGDAATNTTLHLAIEPGAYTGIAFDVGVPEALNHENPVLAWPPLDRVQLHWSWLEGYRFMRMEFELNDGTPVSVHLGSAKCRTSSSKKLTCDVPNRPFITVDAYDPETSVIALDVTALLTGSDFQSEAPDCISGAADEACAPVLERLGVDPESGKASESPQSVFRSVPR